MRYLFLPSFNAFQACTVPCTPEGIAGGTPAITPPTSDGLPGVAGTEWVFTAHLSNTQGLQCVSVSPRTEDGVWFFKQLGLIGVKQPQNFSNVQFLILDQAAQKLLLLDSCKIKNLPSVSYNLPNFYPFWVTPLNI